MAGVRDSSERAIRIGVNAHLLSLAESYRSAGISWYIQNLLRHLPEADPALGYTVFVGEKRYPGVPGLELRLSRMPTHRPPARIFWEQALQPWALRREGVDLLHGMALVGPLVTRCPFVVTIHDLSFVRYPQNFHGLKRRYLQAFTRLSVRRARRVIAISENTKRDIVRTYGLEPTKVDMIHYGLDRIFQPLSEEVIGRFRSEKGLPDRFVLFVGTLEPRKNVARLIEAYARLPKDRPALILVGGKGWLYDEIFDRVQSLGLDGEVLFAGYAPAKQLPYWYNAADLFVYPSLYEGFGLPPLESMACGTPVVTSSVSSLPEVVGRAGCLVDPEDTEALASTMLRLLRDPDERADMSEAGLAQAQIFSWRAAAKQTVETYRRALMAEGDG